MAFNASPQYPGSYLGVRAPHPPNVIESNFIPGPSNWQNVVVGDLWIYEPSNSSSTGRAVYMLVSLVGNQALWVLLSAGAGTVVELTGNAGSNPVTEDGAGNINILGDGTTINVTGNGSHTLTVSAITSGTTLLTSLTGDSGGIVHPTAGNINVLFSGNGSTVSLVGNPGTSTLGLVTNDANGNIFFGNGSGNNTLTGTLNTCFGYNGSLTNLTNGSYNAVFGYHSGTSLTSGSVNTILGSTSGSLLTSGSYNVIIGNTVGNAYTSSESSNILIGVAGTVPGVLGESNAIRIGANGNTSGYQNTCFIAGIIGNTVSNAEIVTINSSTGQLGVGAGSGTYANSFPTDSGTATPASGILNIKGGLSTLNCGSSVEFTGSSNTVLLNVTDANSNTILGKSAGVAGITGTENTVLGGGAGTALTSGYNNDAFGAFALAKLTSGAANVGMGHAVGYNTVANTGLTTGSYNVFLGYNNGTAYTGAESYNILIGPTAGVAGESNVFRVANDVSAITKAFIQGIAGVTTVINDAVPVLISASTGQLGTVSSSIRYKENVKDLGNKSDFLHALRPVSFKYKSHSSGSESVGLIAEEVAEVAPQLVIYNKDGQPDTVKYQELVPHLLNEVQKQEQAIQQLQIIIEDLMLRLNSLEK